MAENMLKSMVRQEAEDAGLDPDFVLRLAGAESSWKPGAVSEKGAAGIMQLMPETAKRYGVTDRFNPAQNIRAGVAYLKDLTKKYGPDRPDLIAAAYNAGEGAVDKHGGVPPFQETQQYVEKVDPFAKWAVPTEKPAPAADPFTKWAVPPTPLKPGENPPMAKTEDFLPPKPQGSAVERFVSGAWKNLNPVTMVGGLANAVVHPLDTASNIIESHKAQALQALDLAKQGRYSEAVGHGAAAALPLVGPAAANAGESIRKGLEGEAGGDVAGGLGEATGLLAPFAAQKALEMRAPTPGMAASKAARLTREAEEQVAGKVLAPGNIKYKGIAAKQVAPEILARKLTGGREELQQAAVEGMESAGSAIDDAIQASGGTKAPIPVNGVIARLKARINDLRDANGNPFSNDAQVRINLLEERITQLRGHGGKTGTSTFEDLRSLRDEQYRIAHEASGYERMGNPIRSDEGWAAREMGSAIREEFAQRSPATAAANADYAFWKNLRDVLDPVMGRPKQMGRTMGVTGGERVAAAVAGHAMGLNPVATAVMSWVVPAVRDMLATPKWQLASASKKMELAQAIKSGSIGRIKSAVVRLEQTTPATNPSERQTATEALPAQP